MVDSHGGDNNRPDLETRAGESGNDTIQTNRPRVDGRTNPERSAHKERPIAEFHHRLLGRRSITLVIRAFIDEDGSHYGSVSDATGADAWQATFTEFDELIHLVLARMAAAPAPVRNAYPDGSGPERGK